MNVQDQYKSMQDLVCVLKAYQFRKDILHLDHDILFEGNRVVS